MASASEPSGGAVRLGRARVDLDGERVIDPSGHSVALRPQAFAVLRVLLANPGRLVTKDDAMQAVWPGVAVTDDSLVQCIGEIRKALGDDDRVVVETVPRRGYRLAVPPAAASLPPPRRRSVAMAIALLGLVLVLAAAGTWRALTPADTPAHAPAIAVLPFDSRADAGGAYLGPGVAETVIAMLARSPDVTVVARGSSFAYGGGPRDVREIGEALGVDYVLEGSVRREGDKLRVTAELEDAKSGRQIWAERFDRAGADPWALVDDVTGKIIGSLVGEDGELKRAQFRKAWGKDTAPLGEYDYYLRGLDVYFDAETPEQLHRGGRIWAEGVARYPDSAMLRAKLGWYNWTAAWDFFDGDIAAHFAEADRLVTEVLAMDNLSPETERVAHWLNAFVLMWRREFDRAAAEAEIAAEISPYDGNMLRHLTDVLIAGGYYDMALEWLDRAEPLDPGSELVFMRQRAYIDRLTGRYEDSARGYGAGGPMRPYGHLSYAISLVHLGRLDEARSQVRAALRQDPAMTQAVWREGSVYRYPTILDGEIETLAQVGLPEG